MSNTFSGGSTVPSVDNALGAWARDDLASTVATAGGLGADSDLPDRTRFIGAIAKLLRKRLAIKPDTTGIAAFLMTTDVPPSAGIPQREPWLNAGRTELFGRLWFVTPVAVAGQWVALESNEGDVVVRLVEETLGHGATPAIVVLLDDGGLELRFYPHGLQSTEDVMTTGIDGTVTIEAILKVIDHVWVNKMVTPGAQPAGMSLWSRASEGRPAKDAEARAQAFVEIGLQEAFPWCTVRHEQSLVSGRLDLEVEEADWLDRSLITRHAILEMKVLRQMGNTGDTVSPAMIAEWVREGVEQVIAYKTERGARGGSVCCFDMRADMTDEACFDHVRDEATNADVTLRVWHLYRSAIAYRRAGSPRPA